MKYFTIVLILRLFLAACSNEGSLTSDKQATQPPYEDSTPVSENPTAQTSLAPTPSPNNVKWWIEELCSENMVGTWQTTNHVSDAYTELLVLRSDHTYTFYKSGYNYAERELSSWGTWDFAENILTLRKEYRKVIKGGTLEDGVLAGTQEYIGGEIIIEKMDTAESFILPLSQFIDQTMDGIILS